MPRVDLHAHLLPSLDDGPQDIQESLAMARAAAQDGTDIIVATPHQRDVMLNASVEKVRDLAGLINEALAREAVPGSRRARVLMGMENHIEPDLPDWVDQGKALTLNRTRFILAEPPFTAYPPYVDDVLSRLSVKRLVPVIAHPERSAVLQRNPRKVLDLVERGMVIQVTAGSFLGAHGPAAQRAAVSFLRRGLVHIVASDMHHLSGHRTPGLQAAFERVTELAGEEQARLLFEVNPEEIIEDRRPRQSQVEAGEAPRRWWQVRLPWLRPGEVRDLLTPARWRGRGG